MKCPLLFVVMCATALHAQQTGQRPANVDYVEIPVRVIDNKGRFVRDLTQRDFELQRVLPARLLLRSPRPQRAALRRNEIRVNRSGTNAFYRRTYVAPQ